MVPRPSLKYRFECELHVSCISTRSRSTCSIKVRTIANASNGKFGVIYEVWSEVKAHFVSHTVARCFLPGSSLVTINKPASFSLVVRFTFKVAAPGLRRCHHLSVHELSRPHETESAHFRLIRKWLAVPSGLQRLTASRSPLPPLRANKGLPAWSNK